MKTFNFSLQRVLDLRVHRRKQAEQTLARVRRQRRDLEEDIRQLRERWKPSRQGPSPSEASLEDFRRIAAYRRATREKLQRLRERLEELKTREEQARDELVERRRAEETLQTLYENEREAHVNEQTRANQRLMDEQAIAQYLRESPFQS